MWRLMPESVSNFSFRKTFRGAIFLTAGILLSCCSVEVKREVHSLDSWLVVYTDEREIFERCMHVVTGCAQPCFVKGCADFANKTIYCRKYDFETCGHELHHITDGVWHEHNR